MSMLEDDTRAKGDKAAPKARDVPFPKLMALEQPPYKPGVMRVAVDRFFKQEYHDLEVERIWKKTWQWACREEDLQEIGDHIVYEIAELSFIIVRTTDNEIKAFWNSCPHRGRKLCDFEGKRALEFRCMYHGWAWDISGKMIDMTCGWDFPGTRDEVAHLREAKVGVWGGFVFINPDPDCEPLADFLGTLPDYFKDSGFDLSKRWAQVRVCADLPVNWKVAAEAFLEAWHVSYTHPQMVKSPAHMHVAGNRWDVFGNWMRMAPSLPTDKFKPAGGFGMVAETEQQVIDMQYDFNQAEERPIKVGPGETAADIIAREIREVNRSVLGDAIDAYHDVHMQGGEMLNLWPNMHPWGGFSRIVYRFRPYRSDPNRCFMDVLLLGPWPEDRPRPPPAPIHYLGPDQSIMDAPEIGVLARVFSQDLANLPHVQSGLKTSPTGYVILSSLNDSPVRRFHDLYDKAMGFEDGDYLAGVNAK